MTDAPDPPPEPEAGPEPAPESTLGPPVAPQSSAWDRTPVARRPLGVIGALVVLVLWIAVSSLGLFPRELGPIGIAPVPQALSVAFLLLCLLVFRWPDTGLGLPRPGSGRALWFAWVCLLCFAALVIWLGPPPLVQIIGIFALMFWIAISEELMFRSLLFPALRRRMRIWPAMLLTSLIFGVIHLGNGFESGNVGAAAVQSAAAVVTGLLLLALRLRSGSIWPPVVFHLLWNCCALSLQLPAVPPGIPDKTIPPDPSSLLFVSLLLVLPNGLYALWLLRHAGRRDLPGDIPGAP